MYLRDRALHDQIAREWAQRYADAPLRAESRQLVLTLSSTTVGHSNLSISGTSAGGTELASVQVPASSDVSTVRQKFLDNLRDSGKLSGAATRNNVHLVLPSGYLLKDEEGDLGIQDIIEGDGAGQAAYSAKRACIEQTHGTEHEDLGLSEDAALAKALRLSEDSHLDDALVAEAMKQSLEALA